jgi:hypothetical protein
VFIFFVLFIFPALSVQQQPHPIPPEVLATTVISKAASDFSGSKSENFNIGMGWNFPYPSYNREVELIPGHPNPCKLLDPEYHQFNDNLDVDHQKKLCSFENVLEDSLHCYYDWSTIHETKAGTIKIQPNHLDVLAKTWDKLKTTSSTGHSDVIEDSTIHVNGTLGSYKCGSGCASGGSTPDGYFFDPSKRLRGVMEVESSIETPNSSLRQGVSSAINIAYSLVDHGVDPWDVVVPIVSSNGSLFQFACVTLLYPCFPVVIPITSVLDIGLPCQRTLVAQYFLSIDLFLNLPLANYRDAPVKVERVRGLDVTIYHRKYLSALYSARSLPHQALFYLFETLNKTYSTPCHQFIVYPLCVREKENDEDASLIFLNICKFGYQIGVPVDHHLQQLYINKLSQVIESIHLSGYVHLDLYPSNIMWKYDEHDGQGMSILVIDWDSIHEIGKQYDSKTQSILERKRGRFKMDVIKASTEWDSAHFIVIKNNLDSFTSTDKTFLDETFQQLWREWTNLSVDEIEISMQQFAIQTNIEEKTGECGGKAKAGENS